MIASLSLSILIVFLIQSEYDWYEGGMTARVTNHKRAGIPKFDKASLARSSEPGNVITNVQSSIYDARYC
jgi:hypothetical protein